jgi:hypothetical protein
VRFDSQRYGCVVDQALRSGSLFHDSADGCVEADGSVVRELDGFDPGVLHSHISDVAIGPEDEYSRELPFGAGKNEVDSPV